MYCIASNYSIDAVRSFLVVPVNVNMLESIDVANSTGDTDGDGRFTIHDFYSLVWDYGWTYDALAQLSAAVYRDNNTAIEGADIMDTLGFCAGRSSGLTGSGILYSSSVKLINKVQNSMGEWTYDYPNTNDDLVAFAKALNDLFTNSVGVCTLSSDEAKNAGIGGVGGDLDGIRNRFATNMILFGGVTMVAAFEDAVYQNMNEPGKKGFGFVPVPLYKQDEAKTEKYQTVIQNLARIVAISASTTEFEQCSAFLDYQSANSSAIFEKYCSENLVAAIESGEAGKRNVAMLTYIRNHARDCFDKTYEDIIYDYQSHKDHQAYTKRWHAIFYTNAYKVTNMAQRYGEEYPGKYEQLITVLAEWNKLS